MPPGQELSRSIDWVDASAVRVFNRPGIAAGLDGDVTISISDEGRLGTFVSLILPMHLCRHPMGTEVHELAGRVPGLLLATLEPAVAHLRRIQGAYCPIHKRHWREPPDEQGDHPCPECYPPEPCPPPRPAEPAPEKHEPTEHE